MLLLLVIPVLLAVAAFQRYLAVYAPSNVLIRHVRTSPPSWKMAAGLAALAAALLLAMRGVQLGISAGGPGWLNLVVVLLAWDAIKTGCLTIGVLLRSVAGVLHRRPTRVGDRPTAGFVGSSRV